MKTITSLKKTSLALLATGLSTLAFAQTNNMPMGVQPAPNTPVQNAPAQNLPERMLNALTAQQFVTDAAVGGMKEVSLGRLALANSQNAEVKTFANRMIQDHSAANARLEQIARNEGLDLPATNMFAPEDANWSNPALTGSQEVKGAYLLTTNLPVADYQDFKQLKSLSGKEFDVAYAKAAVNDHINTVREFELAQRLVSDPQLNQFAASTLPTIRMHLQMARRLENELVGAPTAGTEPNQAMPAGQPLSSAGGM